MKRPDDMRAESVGGGLAPDALAGIVDQLLEGFQVIGPDFRYVYVNDTVVAHGRTERAELLGRTMMDAYPGIEATEMFAILRRCMNERTPAYMENHFAFPDGTDGWFELRMEPVPAGVAILSVDITARKRAEAALFRTTRALRVLSLSNHTLVRATDESKFVRDVCNVLVSSGGYRAAAIAEADGEHVRPLAHASRGGAASPGPDFESGPLTRTIAEVVRSGAASAAALSATATRDARPDGGPGARAVLPIAHAGRAFAILVIEADDAAAFDDAEIELLGEMAMDLGFGITSLRERQARAQLRKEREELHARLDVAHRLDAVGRMASGVAHDFNNLLGVIIGSAELAAERLGEADPARADLDRASDAAHMAAGLTRQLLAIGRSQAAAPTKLDLNTTITELRGILVGLLGAGIEVELDLAPDLGVVEADRVQVQQVIVNLAINARDAMPGGGRLVIRTANVETSAEKARRLGTRPAGRYVSVAVRDTGHGMPPEVLERVFEPFFTTKPRGSGTGLGLPTVYGIVKQGGGDVGVTSEPGRGTEFVLYFPRIDAAPSGSVADETAAPAGSGTVLVVEDNEPIRDLVRRVLGRAGYRVLVAEDGVEALEIVGRVAETIDLVLTDVAMPRMSGVELGERLQAQRPELRILFVTGDGTDAVVPPRLLQAGARVLGKPFANAELVAAVRSFLRDEREG